MSTTLKPEPASPRRHATVFAIGSAQIVAWASSTYLPAVVAKPVALDLGLAPATVFGAFSCALVVMAGCGPAVGRAIDRHGGRGVLCLSNLVLAGGLVLLGSSTSLIMLYAAWAVLGAGMALGLYDAAFAALVRLDGAGARGPITGVTLLGGFASTIGWPLTAFLVARWDWRSACYLWAAVHLVLVLPVHWFGVPALASGSKAGPGKPVLGGGDVRAGDTRRKFLLLTIFGAATAFVTSAMAAHLPSLLVAAGTGTVAAIAAAALFGPAQVAARLFEYGVGQRLRLHPLTTARLATLLHPVAGIGLATLGGGMPFAAAGFVVLHGAGNGLITIAKGTLPLALFGASGYGARQGMLAVAQRIMQAAAPFVFAVVLESHGAGAALSLSVTLSLLAVAALFGLRRP
jgi:MFS family permease